MNQTQEESICRVCLKKEELFQSIFEIINDTDMRMSFAELITLSISSSVHITQNDGLPNNICLKCSQKVLQFHTFKLNIENNERFLKYKSRYASRKNANNECEAVNTSSLGNNGIVEEVMVKEEKTDFNDSFQIVDVNKLFVKDIPNCVEGESDPLLKSDTKDRECSREQNKSINKISLESTLFNNQVIGDYSIPEESSDDDNEGYDVDFSKTQPEVQESEDFEKLGPLPKRSGFRYEKTYEEFILWCQERNETGRSETVLLEYFSDLVKKGLLGSLMPKLSMLKATLNLKENVDISEYNKLLMFVKEHKQGYTPKKSKVLEKDQIQKFLSDAPNELYLMTKVALIFGVAGALRKEELLKLEIDEVKDLGTKFQIKIKSRLKKKHNKVFTILDNKEKNLLSLIRQYISLRPKFMSHKRFFIFYKNSKCSRNPIGINTFSKLPSHIAAFLKLEHSHLYTGHCFRRSSASMFSDFSRMSTGVDRANENTRT